MARLSHALRLPPARAGARRGATHLVVRRLRHAGRQAAHRGRRGRQRAPRVDQRARGAGARAGRRRPADRPASTDTTLRTALSLLLKTDASLAGETWPAARAAARRPRQRAADSRTERRPADAVPGRQPQRQRRGPRRPARSRCRAASRCSRRFDANQTMLAALMRETSRLIGRGDDERSGLENIAHGIKPLLGPWSERSEQDRTERLRLPGPRRRQVADARVRARVRVAGALSRRPRSLIKVLKTIVEKHENEATGVRLRGARDRRAVRQVRGRQAQRTARVLGRPDPAPAIACSRGHN